MFLFLNLTKKIILLAFIVLQIESIFHNKRILETIFSEIIESASRLHESSNNFKQINATNNFIYDVNENNNFKVDTVDEYFNLTIIQKDSRPTDLCKACNQNSLRIITNYNSIVFKFNFHVTIRYSPR